MSAPRVLIVEDERALGLALAATVRQASASGEIVTSAGLARKKLEEGGGFAAMILDIGLPDQNGLEFLSGIPEEKRPPTIVITAHGEIENTIAARKLEVVEFLTKPLDFSKFTDVLKRVLQTHPKETRGERASGPFIGAAPAMRPVFQHIAHACASPDPVLLSGETGTGKSTAAALIFRNSVRSAKGLEVVRPGTEELGAAWERARGGGLIVEGIEQFDAGSQLDLVRWWDSDPEGAPRILATSGPDLHGAVQDGRIRSDLYYRLQVLEVKLPALRERAEDIPALFEYFLGMLEPGRTVSVSGSALGVLGAYGWPGNLRELRNVASYTLLVGRGARRLEPSHLPSHLSEPGGRATGVAASDFEREFDLWVGGRMGGGGDGEIPTYRELADELERMLIGGLLSRFDGKLARLAKAMGANRTTLRKKLRGASQPISPRRLP